MFNQFVRRKVLLDVKVKLILNQQVPSYGSIRFTPCSQLFCCHGFDTIDELVTEYYLLGSDIFSNNCFTRSLRISKKQIPDTNL